MRRWLFWILLGVLVIAGIAAISVYALRTSPVTPPLGPPSSDGGAPAPLQDAGVAEASVMDAGAPAWEPFPAGPLRETEVAYQVVILPVRRSLNRATVVAQRAARTHFRELKVITRKDAELSSPGMAVSELKLEGLSYPDLTLLGRGLDQDTRILLSRARKALVLEFQLRPSEGFAELRRAARVAHAIAAPIGAVLYDAESREYVTPGEWRARKVNGWGEVLPQVPLQISIHSFAGPEAHRSVTFGMAKFGLPDLVVEAHPPELASVLATVINLAAQTLLEQPALAKAGELGLKIANLQEPEVREEMEKLKRGNARGEVTLKVAREAPDERDPQNRLMVLKFGGTPEESRAGIDATIRALFGP